MAELKPLVLQDALALIEIVFPAQKVSHEAQTERKAVAAQTLTGLGSYWKGRKPLILVRAIVLGSLLPPTDDSDGDLEVFESLMGFDEEGLARRAMIQSRVKPMDFATQIALDNPWDYFKYTITATDLTDDEVDAWKFPFVQDEQRLKLRWQPDIDDIGKIDLYRRLLSTKDSYEAKAALCKRPEEVDQDWLYAPVWEKVNKHYAHLGIEARSHQELVEQLGILRYGHRPHVGDSFCGAGSIPFEAARLGCDIYASDLNPVACMLTWGALNIVGASKDQRSKLEKAQLKVNQMVDKELSALGVEHDNEGNRAKAYLYCLETRCPETGWTVPLLPSRVISPKHGTIAMLKPDPNNQRFDIEVVNGASPEDIKDAETGTVQNGSLTYELDGKVHNTPVKTLRGDYRDKNGQSLNQLRPWEKLDFVPQEGDIFQERLYAIQWITKATIDEPRQITYFKGVTPEDMKREQAVEQIVSDNLAQWQEDGLVPDMEIEPGKKTDDPIRTRGWTCWHHLFNPRQILLQALAIKTWRKSPYPPLGWLNVAKMADFNSRLCRWAVAQGRRPRWIKRGVLQSSTQHLLQLCCSFLGWLWRILIQNGRGASSNCEERSFSSYSQLPCSILRYLDY